MKKQGDAARREASATANLTANADAATSVKLIDTHNVIEDMGGRGEAPISWKRCRNRLEVGACWAWSLGLGLDLRG